MKLLKQTFTLAVLLLALVAFAKPAKVVIVGNRDFADLLYSELTGKEDIELYERDAIQAVLAEHKISAFNSGDLCRYFPHADFFVVLEPLAGTANRVIVFNARSSQRYADFPLPPESDALKKAALNIANAVGKRDRDDLLTVAISSVLDGGVPKRYRDRIGLFVRLLEERMVVDSSIILLERDRLGKINLERDITGQSFPLAPSARLLRLEFTPGAMPPISHCTVRITNLEGKVLAKSEFQDVFSSIPQSTEDVYKEIKQRFEETRDQTIKVKEEAKLNSSMEAARHYEGYRKLNAQNSHAEAEKALSAAIALDPASKTYQKERIDFLFRKAQRTAGRLKICEEIIELIRKNDLAFRYIDNSSYYYPGPQKYFQEKSSAWRGDFGNSGLTPDEWIRSEALAAEYRQLILDSLWAAHKKKPPTTERDLRLYRSVFKSVYFNPMNFVTHESFLSAQKEGLGVVIGFIDDYMEKNPTAVPQMNKNLGGLMDLFADNKLWWFNHKALIANIELASHSKAKPLREFALEWKCMKRVLALPKITPEAFRACVQEYYQELIAMQEDGKVTKLAILFQLTTLHFKDISTAEMKKIIAEEHQKYPQRSDTGKNRD